MKVALPLALKDCCRRLARAAPALTLAAFVLGARWGWVDRFGTDLPWWDQWDAEGRYLLAPWYEQGPGTLLTGLFRAHNEHRVVLTKLVNFALTLADGCWDQRLQLVVNALLPATIAAALLGWSRRFCPQRAWPLIWLVLAAGWALPLAWPNVLSAFHSQQFFLVALSLGTIAWLPAAPPGTRRWWLGAACAVLALGSMASGFFAALVAGALIGWRLSRRETDWRSAWPGLAIIAAVVLTAVVTRATVEYHEVLKAHSWHDFGLTFWYGLQWPWPHWSPLALVLWAPWAWLALVLLRSRRGETGADGIVLLGLGGWVLLQLLATAYARGGGAPEPAPRYMDTLVFGLFVNALALGWLVSRPGARRSILGALTAVWVGAFTWGVVHYTHEGWQSMHQARDQFRRAEVNVRAFLLTNDSRLLETTDVPYPNAEAFIGFISHPSLRTLLPASVRPPLEMMPARVQGFHLDRSDEAAPALPSGIPALPHESFWSSWAGASAGGTGEWSSGQLDSGSRELLFHVAGARPGVALVIRDSSTLEARAQVEPSAGGTGGWKTVAVPTPAGSFTVTAKDHSGTGWLAFTAPVEVPALSWYALWLTRHGWLLAGVAAGVALFLALLTIAFPVLAD